MGTNRIVKKLFEDSKVVHNGHYNNLMTSQKKKFQN